MGVHLTSLQELLVCYNIVIISMKCPDLSSVNPVTVSPAAGSCQDGRDEAEVSMS